MFYSQLILARKGPLGKVWLAAHWDKKLTKISVLTTDISESVESILDPSTPLALRVSGHLMLGVVRIYARKVKYLMADVTEVMWKVKMAYKIGGPGAVDMADVGGGAAIDDPRFFGNIEPDYDYPELVDAAFSQNMLTQYNELKAARGRTLNTQYMQAKETSSILESNKKKNRNLLPIGEEEQEEELSLSESNMSRVSDIEMMRGERSRSTLHSAVRTSMSSAGMKFIEDEIPAYIDDQDMYAAPTTYDIDQPMAYEAYEPLEEQPAIFGSPILPQDDSFQKGVSTPESLRSKDVSEETIEVTVKRKVIIKRKRPMITLDERVELSSKAIKEQLANRAPILRRMPGDKLPRRLDPEEMLTAEQMLTMPSVRDLCPELMELFQMTMTMGSLPFPLLKPRTIEEQEGEGEGVEDVELARYEREHSTAAGRTSVLDASGGVAGAADALGYEDFGDQYEGGAYDRFEEEYPASQPGDFEKGIDLSPMAASRTSDKSSFLEGFEGDTHHEEGASVKVATIEACNARTAKVIEVLKTKFEGMDSLSFSDLTGSRPSRRTAASCFFEVLQLNTWGLISTEQTEPFGEITLRASDKLWVSAH